MTNAIKSHHQPYISLQIWYDTEGNINAYRILYLEKIDMAYTFNFIDLFAGAGGLSEGLPL